MQANISACGYTYSAKHIIKSTFFSQTSTRAHLDTMLHEAQISNYSLKREVDILKSGISEIVEVFSGTSKSTPKKPVRVISGKGSITIPVQGKKRQQETEEQTISLTFSQVSCCVHRILTLTVICVSAFVCVCNLFHILDCMTQVKLFDTPCDVDRIKEWAVGTVKHEVSSRDNAIKVLVQL